MAESGTLGAIGTVGLKGLKWAWNHQDEVEPKLKQLYRSMRRKVFGRSPGILILGAGGTGKTTLGRILSGKYNFLSDTDTDYEQSVAVQTFRRGTKPNVELVVAPGQEDRRLATWPELLGRLSRGGELGIIHCCAFGHHSLTSSWKHHKLYDLSATAEAFLAKFLADRREEETRILNSIMPAIDQNVHATWLLSLVGKEDLWFHEEKEVREFYSAGSYGRAIDALVQRKGNRLFRHEIVFGSLVISNFATARGEVLKTNGAGYDHSRQVHSLRQLFETISGLEQWKAK